MLSSKITPPIQATSQTSNGRAEPSPLSLQLPVPPQVMWVCNLCRKQQEILTKSGAWFYGAGDPRGVFEGPQGRRHEEAPQEKKAKLQDPSLYQGPSGDRSGRHPGLPRQHSLNNGAGSSTIGCEAQP